METKTKSAGSQGYRAKLLAAVAVFAVVACALCAFAPTADAVDATDRSTEILEVTIGEGEPTKYTYSQLSEAISAINGAAAGTAVTVEVLNDFTADLESASPNEAAIWFNSAADVTIDGNGKTITALDSDYESGKNVLGFSGAGTYTVQNLNIDGSSAAHHGINIYQTDVTLTSVSVANYNAAGITVNGATVEATGITATSTVANAWGGINVDKGGKLTIDSIKDVGSVWTEEYTSEGSDTASVEIGSSSSVVAELTYDSTPAWHGFYASANDMAAAYTANQTSHSDYTGASLDVNRTTELKTDISLSEGDTLTIASNAKFTTTATIDGSGKIVGTITLGEGGSIGGDVDDTEMSYDIEYKDFYGRGETTQSLTFPQQQRVIVAEGDTWTITSGNVVTILGEFIVEGTLVIEDGGKLVLGGTNPEATDTTSYRANMDVSGSIVVDGGDIQATYANATVTGSIFVETGSMYIMKVGGDGFVIDGTLEVSTDASLATDDETTLTIGANGVADIYGLIGNGTVNTANIDNKGTLTVDNGSAERASDKAGGNLDVSLSSNGATFNLNSYLMEGATSRLSVTDEGMSLGTETVTSKDHNKFGIPSTSETVVFSGPLVITVSSSGNATTGYTHTMDVSGTIYSDAETAQQVLFETLTEPSDNGHTNGIAVTDVLDFGEGVYLRNSADLSVSGQVTAVSDEGFTDGTVTRIVNTGTISIEGEDGMVRILSDALTGTVNAAYYQTREGTPSATYHNYTSFSGAVEGVMAGSNLSSSKNITIKGDVSVMVDVDVPSPVKVDVESGAHLVIGDTTDEGRDVVVTMADGTEMTAVGEIRVNGSLTYDNKRNDKAGEDKTIADVIIEDVDSRDGFRTYTNIYTALEGAEDGSTVTVSKKDGYVVIDKNVTIPTGVTLVVPSDKASLLLRNGVTMTVDGTLTTSKDIYAENEFNLVASNVENGDRSSVIVVNGTLQSDIALDYDYSEGTGYTIPADCTLDEIDDMPESTFKALSAGSPIAGAYYTTSGYTSVISSVSIAIDNADGIVYEITVNGVVSAGDLVFAGGADCTEIVIGDEITIGEKTVISTLTVNSLVLDGTKLDVTTGAFNGTVSVGDASIVIANITGVIVQDLSGMSVSGKAKNAGTTAGTIDVTAGSANVSAEVCGKTTVTVAAGATLVSSGAYIANLVVNGTVDIATGNSSTITAVDVTINEGGVMEIGANETATITNLTVYGTFTVASSTATTSAGSASVTNLYVGITPEDAKQGNAATTGTVNGAVSGLGLAYVSPEATVDDAILAVLYAMTSTNFDVEGSIWFTIYSGASASITLPVDVPKDDVLLNGWKDESGATVGEEGIYTPERNQTLYADIDYDIFTVYVLANEAVDDVFIDGQLMQYGMIFAGDRYYYGYYAKVAAGSHTISYTLANGYSGEGVLLVNGAEQSGLSFSTSEDSGLTYNLQLSGFVKSGYTPDTPGTPAEEDSGLGITEYLLIILVVLIVIMAIIVALRLMRS